MARSGTTNSRSSASRKRSGYPTSCRHCGCRRRRGGHHAHVVFTERRIYREKGEVVHYFTPDELRDAYRGWIILRHEEGLIPCAQDGVRHVHSVETILAQRP